MEITEAVHIFGLLYLTVRFIYGVGYNFGRIFTISSGHPGPDKERRKKKQVWPRVTRLGEFSPNVLLITLDRFLENY
jgi:hypothetical protein